MEVRIVEPWKAILDQEFKKDYFIDLVQFVKHEYSNHTCYPKGDQIFSAFNLCLPSDIKVVIIGQDPYHGEGQANGLCFSVNQYQQHPPSLVNIFKEIETDIGKSYPVNGDLEHWAKQGVLLLNATLTVRAHEAGSHQGKGWEEFTDAVIQTISQKLDNLVFLLWGNYAKRKARNIDSSKHYILHSGHPSPLSANRGLWFGNRHFSKANAYLIKENKDPINW